MMNKEYGKVISRSEPGQGDAGKTGSWRILRPIIDLKTCIPARTQKNACFVCWVICPDGVISKTIPPTVDYVYCKGCAICAEECPTNAICMKEEAAYILEEN